MPEWAVGAMGALGLGSVLLSLVQGWNKRRDKDQELSAEDRKDALGILREALAEKRKDHSDCEQRVTAVEAAQFREREAAARERQECREENAKLREDLEAQAHLVAELRGMVFGQYVAEDPPPVPVPRKLPPVRPVHAVDVVDPKARKA